MSAKVCISSGNVSKSMYQLGVCQQKYILFINSQRGSKGKRLRSIILLNDRKHDQWPQQNFFHEFRRVILLNGQFHWTRYNAPSITHHSWNIAILKLWSQIVFVHRSSFYVSTTSIDSTTSPLFILRVSIIYSSTVLTERKGYLCKNCYLGFLKSWRWSSMNQEMLSDLSHQA